MKYFNVVLIVSLMLLTACYAVNRDPIFVTLENINTSRYLWSNGHTVKLNNIWSLSPKEIHTLNSMNYIWRLISLKNDYFLIESSFNKQFLESNSKGKVGTPENLNHQLEWALEWNIKGYKLKNKANGHFLSSDKNNRLFTTKSNGLSNQLWFIEQES